MVSAGPEMIEHLLKLPVEKLTTGNVQSLIIAACRGEDGPRGKVIEAAGVNPQMVDEAFSELEEAKYPAIFQEEDMKAGFYGLLLAVKEKGLRENMGRFIPEEYGNNIISSIKNLRKPRKMFWNRLHPLVH